MTTENVVFNLTDTVGDIENGGEGAAVFPGLRLGKDDFTISLRAWCDLGDGASGDIVSQFDPVSRTGFSLGVHSLEASCTSRSSVRRLSFGMDAGTDPVWVDVGNPGNSTVLPYGFCEFQGKLFVATCTAEENGRGRIYRYEGGNSWLDCGCPCVSNAITALASDGGLLYAASSTYDTQGTRLAVAGNMQRDGHVYAYDGTSWEDCGFVADCQIIAGLTVLDGSLYASAFDMFTEASDNPATGLYRMISPGQWEFCGNPGERISPITARDGKIMAGGYNKGHIHSYDPDAKKWEDWGRPPYGETTQIYSFVEYHGELLAGTWKSARVFAIDGPHRYRDLGVLGNELEVMGMAVYNGKLYAGTLPLAQIYRYEGGTEWTLIDRLDHTETEYRRAWSMGCHAGRLFCGVAPSGRVYAMTAGRATSVGDPLPEGWCQIIAVRRGGQLSIYLDGKLCSQQEGFPEWEKSRELDISNTVPLSVGTGPTGPWRGKIEGLKIYSYAMTQDEVLGTLAESLV